MQPNDAAARHTVETAKISGDKDAPIGLNHHGTNRSGHTRARVEARIVTPIAIQPPDARTARRPQLTGEENSTIGMNRDRGGSASTTCVNKTGIERTVRIEPHQSRDRIRAQSADQDFVIALEGQHRNLIGGRSRFEGRVARVDGHQDG